MTSLQISLVQANFERLKPMAPQAGLLFYDRLFSVGTGSFSAGANC
jgi:hypothetical protein